nr:MAG: peptidase [Microvirus sp.]
MEKILLTPHFTLEEMTITKTGLSNIPNVEQTNELRKLCRDILEPLRAGHGNAIIVNSGYRSLAVNKCVGGVPTSQHLLGQAADIRSSVQSDIHLWTDINELVSGGHFNVGQCIWYRKSQFIHVSLPTKTHKNQFIIKNK